jgi:hypothetical protein
LRGVRKMAFFGITNLVFVSRSSPQRSANAMQMPQRGLAVACGFRDFEAMECRSDIHFTACDAVSAISGLSCSNP